MRDFDSPGARSTVQTMVPADVVMSDPGVNVPKLAETDAWSTVMYGGRVSVTLPSSIATSPVLPTVTV